MGLRKKKVDSKRSKELGGMMRNQTKYGRVMMGESSMKWQRICKKNFERDYWLALQKELALKAPFKVLAGLSAPVLCSSVLSATPCHSASLILCFCSKSGPLLSLHTYLLTCTMNSCTPTSQPLTNIVKSI